MVDQFNIGMLAKSGNEKFYILKKKIEEDKIINKPIIIFGAGAIGQGCFKILKELFSVKIIFCDNNPKMWGKVICDTEVINLEKLKNNFNSNIIIIASSKYYNEILEKLIENKLNKNVIEGCNILLTYYKYKNYLKIIISNKTIFSKAYDIFSDKYSKKIFAERLNYCLTGNTDYLIPLKSNPPQYFDLDIFPISKDEIFIDGGAFTGDTVKEFLKQTDGGFRKIYSFEPEKSKNEEYLKKFVNIKDIHLLPYGLWNKKAIVSFISNNNGGSRIKEGGNSSIEVISIDEFLHGKEVTFIKMDIEGAELEALKGAKNTIKRYKPKLAICVYHKPMDIVNIPIYLKQIVPEYNIYLRHYSDGPLDTVCYAVCK